MEDVIEAPALNTCMVDVNFNQLLFSQKHECVRRARHISDVAYDVKLNLPRGDHYSGCVQISFKVNSLSDRNLFIDFRGSKIDLYAVNGQTVFASDATFKNHRIELPKELLLVGQTNIVQVFFLNIYRTDGVGLVTFTDENDG